jgi:hypothetical protein
MAAVMLSRAALPVLVASSLLFAAGCGCDAGGGQPQRSSVAPVPSTAATLDVQLGTGTDAFHPVADGDMLSLTYGTQGGQHVWTSVQVKDQGYETARVNLSARDAVTGAPAGDESGWIAELSVPMNGVRTHAGMRNYIAVAQTRRVVLHVDVIAPDGRHGSDERTVTLTP